MIVFLIMLFPIFTCMVEAEANHREGNEVLIFLSSCQNLLYNFLSFYVFLKDEPKITQASIQPLGTWMNFKTNMPTAQRTH